MVLEQTCPTSVRWRARASYLVIHPWLKQLQATEEVFYNWAQVRGSSTSPRGSRKPGRLFAEARPPGALGRRGTPPRHVDVLRSADVLYNVPVYLGILCLFLMLALRVNDPGLGPPRQERDAGGPTSSSRTRLWAWIGRSSSPVRRPSWVTSGTSSTSQRRELGPTPGSAVGEIDAGRPSCRASRSRFPALVADRPCISITIGLISVGVLPGPRGARQDPDVPRRCSG